MPDLADILSGLGLRAGGPRSPSGGNPEADRYTQLIGRFAQHAVRWAAVRASGFRCVTGHHDHGRPVTCGSPAIASCVVCSAPVCFDHGMISPRDGTVICFGCVGEAQQMRGSPGGQRQGPQQAGGWNGQYPHWADQQQSSPGPDLEKLREDHLRTLGLSPGVTMSEIRSTYRKMAAKYHPDKARSEAQRKRLDAQMRKINEAYTWLCQNEEAA